MEAEQHLESGKPDLLLLDLNLSGEDGFDLLKSAIACSFETIVISAYKERAIQAYEYGVLDFIGKPFTPDRLEKALQRFLNKTEKSEYQAKYIAVKSQGEVILHDIAEVIYFKGARTYSEVFFRNEKPELHDKSLTQLERFLPARFVRIHKSYIVNIEAVSSFRGKPGSRCEVQLKNGEILPVGRTRVNALRGRLI